MANPLRDLGTLARRFVEDRGLLLASALAFSFLLCLAPLILLMFSAMGYLLRSEDISAYVLDNAILLLPGYGREVMDSLGALTRERQVTGLVGAAGLVVFATQLTSLTRTVVNAAFRVPARGLARGFAFDLLALGALAVLALVLSAAVLTLIVAEGLMRHLPLPAALDVGFWGRLGAFGLFYTALLALLFFVYRVFPNTGVPTRAALWATLAVAVLWEAARRGFSAYLGQFEVYGQLYGSFGVIVGTLVWVYYSAVIFVFGAELAALLTERAHGIAGGPAEVLARAAPAPAARRGVLGALPAVLLGAGVAVFALQNSGPVRVHLLLWTLEEVPLAAVALGGLGGGALATGLLFWAIRRPPRTGPEGGPAPGPARRPKPPEESSAGPPVG